MRERTRAIIETGGDREKLIEVAHQYGHDTSVVDEWLEVPGNKHVWSNEQRRRQIERDKEAPLDWLYQGFRPPSESELKSMRRQKSFVASFFVALVLIQICIWVF